MLACVPLLQEVGSFQHKFPTTHYFFSHIFCCESKKRSKSVRSGSLFWFHAVISGFSITADVCGTKDSVLGGFLSIFTLNLEVESSIVMLIRHRLQSLYSFFGRFGTDNEEPSEQIAA